MALLIGAWWEPWPAHSQAMQAGICPTNLYMGCLTESPGPAPLHCHCSIQTYLRNGQYARAPEGREMPQVDASSYDRA